MAWAADGAVQSLPGGPAVRQMDLAPPATQIAADVQSLHYGLLVVCLLIFVGVFGVMFYSILKHRKSLGAKPANFHESVKVEIAWTIVAAPAIKAIGVSRSVRPLPTTSSMSHFELAGSTRPVRRIRAGRMSRPRRAGRRT